ncbi:MAG: PQQ-binding-like beta-propeller repeat protein [Planctomycetes bacterium]|nr:PQQ-binding-like beta-propeller repeat protein [Planctomycetota bacterium]
MSRLYWPIGLVGTLMLGVVGIGAEAPTTAPMPRVVPVAPADKDITADVKAWSTDKYVSPPTKFRAGHVTPRKLDAKAIAKTDVGFTVQLPSKAPIPTPTVHKGKVYVSGGFHSKEFYCFDAGTGALVWAIDLDDDGPSAAVVDDGVAVFNTESCTIFAVDSETGKQLWSHFLGDPLTSTPTIANGVVYTSYPAAGGGEIQNNIDEKPEPAPKQNGKPEPPVPPPAPPAKAIEKLSPPCSHVLIALELKTGKILWQRWLESDVMSSPIAVDKDVYCTSFGGVVYKFAQKDGEVLSAVRTRATSAPVVVDGEVFLTRRTDNGKDGPQETSIAWSPSSGAQRSTGKAKDAVYLDEKVQRGSEQAKMAKALDAGNGFAAGAPANANPGAGYANVGQGNVCTMQAFQGSRVLHMGGKNFNCMGDQIVCNDPKTGKELWSHKLDGDLKKDGGFLGAPPAAAGGHLIMTTLKGDVMRMDGDGKIVKKWETKSPSRFQAAVEGGRIYVGTQDGKLICIDTGDKTLTGWSCWGGNAAHTGIGTTK